MSAGQFVDQRLRVVVGQQHAADRGDDTGLGVGRVAQFIERVQVVLLRQCIAHGLVFRTQAHTADAPFKAFAAVHQRIGVKRLMRPVKAADADVGNALASVVDGVGGQGDIGVQLGQIVLFSFMTGSPELRLRRSARFWQSPDLERRTGGIGHCRDAGSASRRTGWPGHHEYAWSAPRPNGCARDSRCRCQDVR